MQWVASAGDLVAEFAAPTTRDGDQVTNGGGYYGPTSRTAYPIAGANDLVTRAAALMTGVGGQVAKDGDFNS